jgi:hypothetical protein
MIRPGHLLAVMIAAWLVAVLWATAGETQARVEWQEVSDAYPPASVELVPVRGADHVAEIRIENAVQHPYGTTSTTLTLGDLAVDIEIDVTSGPGADLYLIEVVPGYVLERRSLSLPDGAAAVIRIWRMDAQMM